MPNFVEKTFAGGSQGATMGKVIELPMHLRVKHMTLCRYIHVHVCIPVHLHVHVCMVTLMYVYLREIAYNIIYVNAIKMYLYICIYAHTRVPLFAKVEFGICAEATLEHLK